MTTEETPEQTGQTPAGEQLRRAREEAGLSVAQVAERQHLRPSVIQAIENGDYQQIDSELFLKGYVRAYAGQVGLNPDMVIAQLDRELEPVRREREMAEEENPLQDIERRKQRKKRVARWIIILLVLGFVAYVGVRVLMPTEMPAPTGAPETPEPDITEPAPDPDPEVPQVQPEAPDEGAEAPETDTPAPEVESAPEVGTVPETGLDTGPLVAEPLQPEQPAPDATVAPQADGFQPAEPQVDAPPIPAPPAPEREVAEQPEVPVETRDFGAEVALSASFLGPCWVEITDANGRRLVAALFDEGDRLQVEGEPPMRVVLGAADAVSELEFRGEIIDLSAYRAVNNRVSFTLDI